MSIARASTRGQLTRRTEARLAAVTARSTSVLAADRCRRVAPNAPELLAAPLRLPSVPGGVPAHPLLLAVATLATANAAVALALELASARGEAVAIDRMLFTAHRTASAARDAIYTLDTADTPRQRQLLAHAAAQATYAAADALAIYALPGSEESSQPPRAEYTLPRAWRTGVGRLELALYGPAGTAGERSTERDSVVAAEVAYDSAAHAVQVCSLHFPRLGACSATHRVTRATCLASTFVGWAALEAAGTQGSRDT
ncbi:MAG TPA: hypothetical protein VI434_11760 [Candidatus Dormibacteraeota bacterium]